MNIKATIYKEVSDKLAELGIYKTIDLWKGQVTNRTNQKETDPIVYPAAFVSISKIQWTDMTFNVQEGEVQVLIYLFFDRYADTFVGASKQDESLQIMENENLTVENIQWLNKEGSFTDLIQSGDQDITERYKRPATILTFDAECFNKLKAPNYVYN